MSAQVERTYDEYERMAVEAIMREGAHRSKRPKAGDLFKRPKDGAVKRDELTDLRKETDRLNDWLSTLRTDNGRKEEANGD